jgi:predicted ATPase
MPGRGLNDTERRLLSFWQNVPTNFHRPLLRSISVSGGSGLRGIDGLIVHFRYPLTAVCGGNGTGKSTLLALSALAHHSPLGWHKLRDASTTGNDAASRTYYRFSDFFLNSREERQIEGVTVTWRYLNGGQEVSRKLTKGARGWGRYSSRLERETVFLPISRILPAHEISGVRSTFLSPSCQPSIDSLNPDFRRRLSFILGKEYHLAEVQRSRRYSLPRCQTDQLYTGFNMGSGETCLISLLHLLQRMPNGGLVVIEEIEIGLHPQAQVRLADILLRVCYEKRLQIICSTHSEAFLDSLPRQARILIRKVREEHFVHEAPSTRFAMYELTGETVPEVVIYCEDHVAAILIEESLPGELRARCLIKQIGSAAGVVRQGVAHLKSGYRMRALCVLDGDVRERQIRDWITGETGGQTGLDPEYLILPGDGTTPERWVIDQLRANVYCSEFARQLACSVRDAQGHIDAISVQLDGHDMWFALHRRTSINPDDCIRRTMRSFASRHPQLDTLRDLVSSILN